MPQSIRMIQAGLGGFGRSWATILSDAPNAELVAVVDPAPAAREWAVSELNIAPRLVFASLDAALAEVEAEAVLVVTPPDTHHAAVTASLNAGCHVLVEKPLATNMAEARQLVAAADRAGRLLMVSQNYRFRAPARAAQALVASGDLGELVAVRTHFGRDTRQIWPPDNFRYAMPHPLVLDMTIHHADLLRLLTGRNVVRVDARSWSAPDSPYQHDPDVLALMELDGGIPAVYDGSWAIRREETSWNADWEIIGTRGRLLWTGGVSDPLTGEVLFQRWKEPVSPVPLPELPTVDRAGVLAAFLSSIERNEPPETSGSDNLNSLAIVLACVQSIDRGEPVRVSDLR